MEYSVLTQPVIPVLMPDGTAKSVGIREAFLKAHEIKDIQGDTPLERYALLRLLIAMAMDMLALKTSDDRYDLLQQGAFDAQTFEDYIRECEKDGPRFDLFDEEHPFLQSKYDEEMDKKALSSISCLFPYVPTGNNHMFFDHRYENELSVLPDQAFRAICVTCLFCFAVGAQGIPSSVNNTPPIYAIVVGKSLFQTIVVNMLAQKECGNIEYGIGTVPWREGARTIIPKQKIADITMIEGLTWLPRRITLTLNQQRKVTHVYYQSGLNFQGNGLWRDPHVPYFYREKDHSFGTIKPEIGRHLWRDVGALVYSTNCQPKVIAKAGEMLQTSFYQIRVLGLAMSNNAKYEGWYEEELSIPKILICNLDAADLFRDDIKLIEDLQVKIYDVIGLEIFANGEQKRWKKTKNSKVTAEYGLRVKEYFLHVAHDLLMTELMEDLAKENNPKDHILFANDKIKGAVQETIDHCFQLFGTNIRNIENQLRAEKAIKNQMSILMKEREKRYAE